MISFGLSTLNPFEEPALQGGGRVFHLQNTKSKWLYDWNSHYFRKTNMHLEVEDSWHTENYFLHKNTMWLNTTTIKNPITL